MTRFADWLELAQQEFLVPGSQAETLARLLDALGVDGRMLTQPAHRLAQGFSGSLAEAVAHGEMIPRADAGRKLGQSSAL